MTIYSFGPICCSADCVMKPTHLNSPGTGLKPQTGRLNNSVRPVLMRCAGGKPCILASTWMLTHAQTFRQARKCPQFCLLPEKLVVFCMDALQFAALLVTSISQHITTQRTEVSKELCRYHRAKENNAEGKNKTLADFLHY